MVARMQQVKCNYNEDGSEYNQETAQPLTDHPPVNYYQLRSETDHCQDPSLLEPLDEFQHKNVRAAVVLMPQKGREK